MKAKGLKLENEIVKEIFEAKIKIAKQEVRESLDKIECLKTMIKELNTDLVEAKEEHKELLEKDIDDFEIPIVASLGRNFVSNLDSFPVILTSDVDCISAPSHSLSCEAPQILLPPVW